MSEKQIDAIRRSLRLGESTIDAGLFYATIKSVNSEKRTCVVVDQNDMEYNDVLLYAVEDAGLKGWVMVPSVDSVVLVGRIGGSNELYVAMTSVVDGARLTVGDKVEISIDKKELSYKNDKVELLITGDKVTLSADHIEFNGGDNKGLIKIVELTDKVNAMIDVFNNHTHLLLPGSVIVAGSPSTQQNAAPIEVPKITAPTQRLNYADYENEKIKH